MLVYQRVSVQSRLWLQPQDCPSKALESSCDVCVPLSHNSCGTTNNKLSPAYINFSRWEQKPIGMVKHDPKWLVNCNGLLLGLAYCRKWSKAGWWRSTGVHHDDKSSKDVMKLATCTWPMEALLLSRTNICILFQSITHKKHQKTILQWLFTKFLWPWWLNIITIIRKPTAMIHHNLFVW